MLRLWPQQALREGVRLLRQDEREREECKAKIAREEVLMSEELTRIVEETEVRGATRRPWSFLRRCRRSLLMVPMLFL